jgi:hypothetical protein
MLVREIQYREVARFAPDFVILMTTDHDGVAYGPGLPAFTVTRDGRVVGGYPTIDAAIERCLIGAGWGDAELRAEMAR